MTFKKGNELWKIAVRVYPKRVRKTTDTQLECRKCFVLKDYTDFSPDKKSPYGVGYWCRQCAAANSRKHHARRHENDSHYREAKRDAYIKNRFGITLQEYTEKLKAQNFLCAICEVKLPTSGYFTHLDHCHKSGKIRAFLCTNCNRGLGHFQDNKEFLLRAAGYLDTHNSNVD